MNRRYFTALTSVLYSVGFVSLLLMIANALSIINFAHGEKIFAGILAVICCYLAAVCKALGYDKKKRRQKIIRKHLFCIFIFYIILLIDFTLIDGAMGRDIFNVLSWNRAEFNRYISTSTNLIPFKTINLFLSGYKNGYLTAWAGLENILGNLMAFMPLPFFTVCLFKHLEKWYFVLAAVFCSVISVELLQLLFMTGASDIDDVILNVSGAMLFYGILKTKRVSKYISKITFGVWETGCDGGKKSKGTRKNKGKCKN